MRLERVGRQQHGIRSGAGSSGPLVTLAPDLATMLLAASGKLIQNEVEMPLSATSVHTKETTATQPTPLSYGEELRLKYPNEWPATAEAYKAWDAMDPADRFFHLDNCRSFAWFAVHKDSGQVKVISSSCHLRWCPLCAESRALFLMYSVSQWYNTASSPKLLTLTLRHSDIPLRDQIAQLYKAFRRLRQHAYMRKRTRGGIWFFQIKWIKKTQSWHPHIHALIDSDFIPHAEIRQRWAKLTQGSHVVDIRLCWSADAAATHVARYATRPGTLSKVPYLERLELLVAMDHLRIVGKWGNANNVPLVPPKNLDSDNWLHAGKWSDIQKKSLTCHAAKAIIFAWKTGYTVDPAIIKDLCDQTVVEKPWLRDAQGNEYYYSSMFDP